ncbi:MAG TPA: hypothetical protein VG269_17505 [Tepidisphaeraceae bacterium]|jgi:hypothetical protein|nr:hypothetical protein [Tepidisphaeraceae bacterium]
MRPNDPSRVESFDLRQLAEGKKLGLQPLHVICYDHEMNRGTSEGVSLIVFVRFVPRVGESICLEDGTLCEVEEVYHKARRLPNKLVELVATVGAFRIPRTKIAEA